MKASKDLDALIDYALFDTVQTTVPSLPYSSSIVYAKKVLEWMELHNYTYILYAPDESLEIPRYLYASEFINLESQRSFVYHGKTMEESICLAALSARGYNF